MSEATLTLTKQISTPNAPRIAAITTINEELYSQDNQLGYKRYISPATNRQEFDYKIREASFVELCKDIRAIAGSDLIDLLLISEAQQFIVVLKDESLDTKLQLYSKLSKYEDMGWDIQIVYSRNVTSEFRQMTQTVK